MRITAWFNALELGAKIGVICAAALIAIPVAMTVAVVPVAVVLAGASGGQPSSAPLTLIDKAGASTPVPAAPVETTADVTTTETVPFAAVQVNDGVMAAGTTAITTVGVPGTLERVFRVTYIDGIESSRVQLSEAVTVAPVDEVTSIGTYVAPPPPPPAPAGGSCDSNYADACVPIASDVDCAGGSGNGPAYVSGIARVVGSDIYDLDRDGDGYGCD